MQPTILQSLALADAKGAFDNPAAALYTSGASLIAMLLTACCGCGPIVRK